MADDMDLECIPHLWKRIPHLWKRIPYLWKSYPHSSKTTKKSCPRMRFCIFMAVLILLIFDNICEMCRNQIQIVGPAWL